MILRRVEIIEPGGDVARHFQVLRLILADRHEIRVEHQNVRRHQDRVAEEAHRHAGIRILTALDARFEHSLVGVSAVHQALGAGAVQQPVEERNLLNITLAIESNVFGIEACGKPRGGNLESRALEAHGILTLDESVEVSQKVEAFHLVRPALLNGGAKGPDVVAQMQGTGSVDACENAFFHLK